MAYYASWSIYGRNFPPQEIQSSVLTHVLYAFAGINNETGEAYLTDLYADIEKKWPGDPGYGVNVTNATASNATTITAAPDAITTTSPYNATTNLYGNLKQLYLKKKQNRNLKTLLSIGGWGDRESFAPALTNSSQGRRTFARTSVRLLADLGFDGLDIDWEYPNSTADARALVDTARLFRRELDAYAASLPSSPPPHFLLSLAVPAGPKHFRYFDVPQLAPSVDFMNLMAYDYMGAFSNFSGHAQNLYFSPDNPRSTDFDTQDPVEYFVGNGLPRGKLVLGMPLYGHAFDDTSGPGCAFSPAVAGSWEPGIWDYKVLPRNGSEVFYDVGIGASWSYDGEKREMVSYDEPAIAEVKAEYIVRRGLGGAMWWECSGDRPLGSEGSLIARVTGYLGACEAGLQWRENVLGFPFSRFGNLRGGMLGEG